jgi:hypothetical protein
VEGAALPLEGVLWCPPFRWDSVFFHTEILVISTNVADPHYFVADPDPDPACHFDADPDLSVGYLSLGCGSGSGS